MDDEVLIAGAAICRQRAGKIYWLLVKPAKDDSLQLPKGMVRRGESSVRAALRTASEMAGVRGKVLEEAGRMTTSSSKDGKQLAKKTIYYLMQQRGKEEEAPSAKLAWSEFIRAWAKINVSERRILSQARAILTEWQKEEQRSL